MTDETVQPLQAALAAFRAGRLEEALGHADAAIALEPANVDAYNVRGVLLRRLGKPEAALKSYDAALAIRADQPGVLNNRANVLVELERFEDALASFEAMLALQPQDASAHSGLGNVLWRLERHEEALAHAEAAIALNPNLAAAHLNRGNALFSLERLEAALASFDTAAALDPRYAKAHNNRGNVLGRLRRLPEALEAFDTAVALDPAYGAAQMNRALNLLSQSQLEMGWRAYEHRWDDMNFVAKAAVPGPLLRRLERTVEASDLAGGHVLLVAEQGVGDVLMFASMIPDVVALAARVTLACEPRLHRLLSRSFPSVRLVLRSEAYEMPADHVVALGSLGRLFRNRFEDFPGRPYLTSSPLVRRRWAERLGPKRARLRLGVSWRGGAARTGGEKRSMALAELRPILDLPDCEFVDLQYGDHADELAEVNASLSRPIRAFPAAEMDDFEDLAGLVQELDGVVSVQTSIIHLSGALGVPALVMVPLIPEWRYATGGSTMPWYGSVRLFRQSGQAAWGPVIDTVAQALASLPARPAGG